MAQVKMFSCWHRPGVQEVHAALERLLREWQEERETSKVGLVILAAQTSVVCSGSGVLTTHLGGYGGILTITYEEKTSVLAS